MTQSKEQGFKNKKPGPRTYFLGGVMVILLVVIGLLVSLNHTAPVDADSEEWIAVQVVPGETAQQITEDLKEKGLISSKTAFQYYLKVHGLSSKLRAGEYQLSPSMTVEDIVDELLRGIGTMVKVTIPEGYTLRDIASTLADADVMTEDTFWELVQNYDVSAYPFLDGCPENEHRLEGFLFPDTYFIAKGATAESVIQMMLDRFAEIWESMPQNNSGLSSYETVILASMIESEARFDEERATIASVYLNRLKKKMLLQCDATILYAMPERKTQLRYSDYKYESEYNTYLHQGLPPTPISNPGEPSLRAACQPEQTEYLYYLWDRVDNDGHVFAKTYEEHLDNQKKLGY